MKKFIYLWGALALTTVSSCSNDDITIETGKEFTINVQPASVITNVGEYRDGDMYSFGSWELRVRSLIYNNEGDLSDYEVAYFDSYQVTAKFLPRLPQGSYTILTTTDFVRNRVAGESQKFDFQHWALKDSTKLQNVYIENSGYVGSDKKILGVDITKVSVTAEGGSVVIKPQMNGSLIQVVYDNPHTQFNGRELYSLSLCSMEKDDKITFSGGTTLNSFENANEYKYRQSLLRPADIKEGVQRVYGYIFQLVTEKCHYAFVAYSQDTNGNEGTSYTYYSTNLNGQVQSTFSLTKGYEYVAYWDLEDIDNPFITTYEEVYGQNANTVKRSDALEIDLSSIRYEGNPIRYYPFK